MGTLGITGMHRGRDDLVRIAFDVSDQQVDLRLGDPQRHTGLIRMLGAQE